MRTTTIAALTGGLLLASGVAVALPAAASTGGASASASSSSSASAPAHAAGAQRREHRLVTDLSRLVSDGTLTQAQADRVASALAADGVAGHRGGDGWGRAELDAAATLLGTTPQQLRSELRQPGATPAGVAEAHGTSTDALVDALVGVEQARVDQRVSAGELTQAQADQRSARSRQHLVARLDQPLHAPHQQAATGPSTGAGA